MTHKILIVDDSEDIRKRNVEIFKEQGFEVFEAPDGLDGLKIAIESKPDIIMTGIVMPKMSGFDMINQLRQNVETAKIPIMVYSHLGLKEDQRRAQEMGIDDFIVMGFVSPIDMIRKAKFRIEGVGAVKNYKVYIDESGLDATKLINDYNLPMDLKCRQHVGEKMVFAISPNPTMPGEFKGKFICPRA